MEALKQLESLIYEKISVFKTVLTLIRLEAKLAGLSVFPLLLNVCMLFIVLLTVWFSGMFFLGYCISLVSNRLFLAIFSVLLLNIGLLIGLLKYLSFNLKNMSFQKTREYFSKNKRGEYDKIQEAVNNGDCNSEPTIAMPDTQDNGK